jgi:hypothetical protein
MKRSGMCRSPNEFPAACYARYFQHFRDFPDFPDFRPDFPDLPDFLDFPDFRPDFPDSLPLPMHKKLRRYDRRGVEAGGFVEGADAGLAADVQ